MIRHETPNTPVSLDTTDNDKDGIKSFDDVHNKNALPDIYEYF